MNDLQKELDQAYKLASALPVSGDGVELMAAVREHLRAAYRLAGKEEEERTDG